MSRALVILSSDADRNKAVSWCKGAPAGTRVEFKKTKRTIPQNDRMWAMLTDIAQQATHCGRKYKPEQWKAIFMQALGQEMEFLPSLDGKTFLPVGFRTSELSKDEMGELMELMTAWGADNGVRFSDPEAR